MNILFAFLLFLCVFVVNCIGIVLVSCRLKLATLLRFSRFSPSHPLQRQPKMHTADIREPFTALSGINRTSREAVVSIQRLAPSLPPVISAGKLHNLHFVSYHPNQKRRPLERRFISNLCFTVLS